MNRTVLNSTLRRIYLVRHFTQESVPAWMPVDWYLNAPLKPESYDDAERVRVTHLADIDFGCVGSSGVRRADESVRALAPGFEPVVVPELGPLPGEDWTFLQQVTEHTMDAYYQAAPGLLTMKGKTGFEAIHSIAMQHTKPTLFVSHQPIIEMVAGAARGHFRPVAGYAKGEVSIISLGEDGNVIGEIERLLPPAA